MRMIGSWRAGLSGTVVLAIACQALTVSAEEASPTLTEVAVERLKVASDFLAAQERFAVRAEIAWDVRQANGQMLEFGASRRVWVRRPGHLRVEMSGRDAESRTLTFDGSVLAIDLPADGAYVAVDRPGTLYAAVDYLVEDLGTPAPLEDLLAENFYDEVGERITSAAIVGEDRIAGRDCDHLAIRSEGADAQFWIEAGDRPFFCRIVVTYKHEPGTPQFKAELSGWDLSPSLGDDWFKHTPADGAERLTIQTVVRGLRDDAKGNE